MSPEKKTKFMLYGGCGTAVAAGMGLIKLAGMLVNHIIALSVGM